MVEQQATPVVGAPPSLAARLAAMPADRWVKCPNCSAFIYHKRLEKNLKVCPECTYHFRLSARERVTFLLDAGSFEERDAEMAPGDPLGFVDSKPYPARIAENRRKSGAKEAAIYGAGTIGGYPVVICVLDFTFLGGSMGSVVGEKVTRAAELAAETHTPLIVCSASGGARMQEGTVSLMQMAKTSAALAVLAEQGVPYFSLLVDPTYGGVSASFATLGDLIIVEPKARVGFAGPQVIEQTIRQKLPAGFQTADFLMEKGQIDLIVPRAELALTFKKLLAYHTKPDPVEQSAPAQATAQTTSNGAAVQRSAWESVQLARHQDRPNLLEYAEMIFDDFTELHGDRTFRDDQSIIGGLALLAGRPVMVIGQQKGRGTRENITRNFGMPHPEGYRKALRLMQYAGRLGLPLLTFIDTPGAYPGIAAEERNQSEAIARNLLVMARLPIPIVCTVIGEGGSGGALAIGVGDRVLMLENGIYSVISPEGCATILFKDAASAPRAAEASRLTARELLRLGIADEVVPEPAGGAHTDPAATAEALKAALIRNLDALVGTDGRALVDQRYARFRAFGEFTNNAGHAEGEPRRAGTAA
ncbi:MAG TPA: acetyl-CoA carboxylase carboxyltransferase subunit alpha [Thermomicrobiales bacterium]|nr:acetyl-CoA carboxylase carboxyltransferase subunit alpha [Thermomicrobiales bacterium]